MAELTMPIPPEIEMQMATLCGVHYQLIRLVLKLGMDGNVYAQGIAPGEKLLLFWNQWNAWKGIVASSQDWDELQAAIRSVVAPNSPPLPPPPGQCRAQTLFTAFREIEGCLAKAKETLEHLPCRTS